MKTCNENVVKYQKGIDLVSRVKSDQGKGFEQLKPAEVTVTELSKRPLSWLGREKQQREFDEAERKAQEDTSNKLDSGKEGNDKKLEDLNHSIEFSVDQNKVIKEGSEEEGKQEADTGVVNLKPDEASFGDRLGQ